MTVRVSVSGLLADNGCMVWEQIKRFESGQDARAYSYRMSRIYGENFQWWSRP